MDEPFDEPAPSGPPPAPLPPGVDPDVAAHVAAVRDRFGVSGLRSAARLIEEEITRAEDALRELGDV